MPCWAPVTSATLPAKRIAHLLVIVCVRCRSTPVSARACSRTHAHGELPRHTGGAHCGTQYPCAALTKQATGHTIPQLTSRRVDIKRAELYHLNALDRHGRV